MEDLDPVDVVAESAPQAQAQSIPPTVARDVQVPLKAVAVAPRTRTHTHPDRITELYRGEIFTAETSRIARERVHWMCQQCEGDTALDVGCSQGITAILLAREGIAVTAIDTDPDSIAFAAAEIALEPAAVRERLSLVETHLAILPDGLKFDTVILGEVLEHQALPERFARQAAAHLRAGGALVITTPFALHPHPDHKTNVMPRHVVDIAASLEFQVASLDVLDGYIRCVLRAPGGRSRPVAVPPDLLLLTEAATLASQRRLYDRLDERTEQLRQRTKALEAAQARVTQVTVEADAAAGERAQDAARVKARHASALAALVEERDRALAQARAAQTASDEARRSAEAAAVVRESALAALVEERDRALAQARAAQTASDDLRRSMDRLEAEFKRSVAELRVAHDGAVAKLESDLGECRTTLDRVRQRALAFHEKVGQLSQETKAARVAVRQAEAEKEQVATSLVQLRESGERLSASSSVRLGRALVRSVRSMRGAMALPGELVSISRDAWAHRRRRRDGTADESEIRAEIPAGTPLVVALPVPARPAPIKRAPKATPKVAPKAAPKAAPIARPVLDIVSLVATYKSGGLDALRLALHSVLTHPHDVGIPVALLKVGRALSAEGNTAADFELATQALAIDESVRTLCGYFWAAQRAAEFERCIDTVRRIEALYGENPTAEQRAMLTKLRNQPAYRLKIFDLVCPAPLTPIEPIAGRICYVLHNSLPYSSGGYGTRAHGVALGVVAAGYDVVALTRPGFPLDVKTNLGPEAVPLEDMIDGLRYIRTLDPQRRGLTQAQYLAAAADTVEARLKEIRPSLVIAASNYLAALPALIAARRLGLPFIYEVRGLWEITRLSREPDFDRTAEFQAMRRLEAQVCMHADHVFTLTEPMRDELVERGVPRERIDLLANSCDPTRFMPRPRDEALAQRLGLPVGVPVIGYIGTFAQYEGLDDLAMACALLKRRGVVFRLMLVGNENVSGQERGPITLHIESVAVAEGFSEWLVMPGRVPHEEVESYYSLVDIAPFPRKPQPVCEMVSPMKPLEALAMEKAVVVSSVRALTEMINDRKTGRMFEKGNIASLANVLQELIVQPAQRAELGRQGRAWVSAERTWNHVGQKFREVMGVVLPGRAEPAGDVTTGPTLPAVAELPALVGSVEIAVLAPIRPRAEPLRQLSDPKPPWWDKIDVSLRDRCTYVDVTRWKLSDAVLALRGEYLARFDEDTVARRIPRANWARADICAQTVAQGNSLLDVGSGLGEFINLVARGARHGELTSIDVRDWDLWFDATGQLRRFERDIFELDASWASDVVTCFEVIEHLPTERVAEAVRLLRSLARQRLYVSVPFMEGLPMHRGHRTRFDAANLGELFPDARFTVYGKGNGIDVRAWIMCEIDMTSARASAPI